MKGEGSTHGKGSCEKVAVKKAAAPAATEQALNIIKRPKKSGGVSTLMKKPRFRDKKVRNTVMRASVRGVITAVRSGMCVRA